MTALAHTDGGDVAVDARVDKGMTLLEARFRIGFAFAARGLDIPTGLTAQRAKDHPEIAAQVKASAGVIYVTFEGRNVKVEGDPLLTLDEAVKLAIMAEFGQTRAWVDATVDVEQTLARNLAIDMGSQIMFSKVMYTREFNAFTSEMFGREGHEGQDARTVLDVLRKMAQRTGGGRLLVGCKNRMIYSTTNPAMTWRGIFAVALSVLRVISRVTTNNLAGLTPVCFSYN